MKTIIIIITMSLALFLSGCNENNKSFLMNKSDFDAIIKTTFPQDNYTIPGSGSSGGDREIEFSATITPNQTIADFNFDFTNWEMFLTKKDNFTGNGKGGSKGLYWRETWRNNDRYISLDGVWLKNGDIRLVFREVLR